MTNSDETTRRRGSASRRGRSGVPRWNLLRPVIAVLVLGIATLLVSACGSGANSGAVSSAAQKAGQAVSSAAAQVKSVTASVTKTQTSSAPAKTHKIGRAHV